MTRLITLLMLLAGLTLIAACSSPAAPDVTAESTLRPAPTPMPTAAGWQPARQPIVPESIPQLRELGILTAPEPPSTVFAHALAIDNSHLAALNNEFLLVWNLDSGQMLYAIDRREANAVMFSPDRAHVYTLGSAGILRIYDALTGDTITSHTVIANYGGIWAYDPFGGWLAVGDTAGAVRVWDMTTQTAQLLPRSNSTKLAALAFSPDGGTLAAVEATGRVSLWDHAAGSMYAATTLPAPLQAAIFAPSGAILALQTGGGVTLLDTASLTTTGRITHGSDGIFAFLKTADILLLGGDSVEITLWDATSAKQLATLPDTTGSRPSQAQSPDGAILLTSTRTGATFWNIGQIASGTVLRASTSLPPMDTLRVLWTDDGLQIMRFDVLGPIRILGIP